MNNSAIITLVLAAGSTSSPYLVQVNISQRLCFATCAESNPVFSPEFTLVGFSQVGAGAYVAMINVRGVISYTPCGADCCATKSQLIDQTFTVPFASTTAPTSVTISQGASVNMIAAHPCQTCSRAFVSETPITMTVA